jgi:hypothetical protein
MLRERPLPLRKEVKRVVRALMGVRGISSVKVFGAMESPLMDEIITTCQTPVKGQQPHPRTRRIQESGNYLITPAPANNFSLPPHAVVRTEADVELQNRRTGDNAFPNVETPRPRRRIPTSRTPSMHIGVPMMFSVPIPAPAEAVRQKILIRKVTPNMELGMAMQKPLPPQPPKSPVFANLCTAGSLAESISDRFCDPEDADSPWLSRVNTNEQSHIEPLDMAAPAYSLPDPKSQYNVQLPSSAHLFIDSEIPVVDDDSDSETVVPYTPDAKLDRFPDLNPFASFSHIMIPLKEEDTTDLTVDEEMHPGYHSDSELATGSLPMAESSRRRPHLSSRASTGLDRFSLGQHMSHLWESFMSIKNEGEVINISGWLEQGGIEDVVRICAHRNARYWNDDTKAREGYLADCVVGWRVVMGDKGWMIPRDRI